MSIEEKAKAYDEALGRAKELIAKWTGKNKDFYIGDYSYIFPELREMDSFKYRLAEYMTKNCTGHSFNISSESILEMAKEELIKRGELKEQKPSIFPPGFGEVKWNPSSPSSVKQKPVEPAGKLSREEYLYQLLIDQLITYSDYEYLTGKNPAWSEEEENKIESIKCLITTGRFADTSTIQTIWNILDDLRPSWKPSELEKGALRTAIHILTDERSFPKAAKQLQNILDAFEKS